MQWIVQLEVHGHAWSNDSSADSYFLRRKHQDAEVMNETEALKEFFLQNGDLLCATKQIT
jgi:hypothetical protein